MSPRQTKLLAKVEKGNSFFPTGCFWLSRFPCLTPVCSPSASSFAHPVEVLQEAKQKDVALGLSGEGDVGKPALGRLSVAVTPE